MLVLRIINSMALFSTDIPKTIVMKSQKRHWSVYRYKNDGEENDDAKRFLCRVVVDKRTDAFRPNCVVQ